MLIPLYIHIFIHIIFAFAVGFFIWKIYGKPWGAFLSAFFSGIAVDFDHFFDYFMAFGYNFNLFYFKQGYQFLKSDKIYVFLHSWEYVIVLMILWVIFQSKTFKTIALALALGLFVHLITDVFLDRTMPLTYSVVFRVANNFDLEKLVYPDHWQKHKKEKKKLGF